MKADFLKISYFLKVAKTKNFSKAARLLYLSPQALNKQVALLEEDLGERLFVRTTRIVQLTEFGEFFYGKMEPAVNAYENALEETKAYLQKEQQSVRVAFFQGMSKRRVVLPVIHEIMANLPQTQINLHAGEMDSVLEDVRQEKADIAISYLHQFEQVNDLEQIEILKIPACVVISYYHPWMIKEEVTPKDMSEMPVLYLKREKGLDQKGFYKELQAQNIHLAPGYNAMLARLETGKEYGVFPARFENLEGEGFKALPLPKEYEFEFTITIFYKKEGKYASVIQKLSSLKDEFTTLSCK